MDTQNLPLWKRWLVHSLIIWLAFNIFRILSDVFITKLAHGEINGTIRERFINVNYYQATPLLILGVILLVEIKAKYFFKKRMGLFVIGSLVTGIIGTLLLFLYSVLMGRHFYLTAEPTLVIAGYAFIYPVVLDFFYKKIFRAETLYEQSRAEINALKAQVQPHFLFNTLNSLYGTAMMENASLTASGIGQLSNLMRYVINETVVDYVPLANELKFIEEYITLQRMRLPDINNNRVTTNIITDSGNVMIAPLLLIPFIENSFKYGLSIEKNSYIHLQLTARESSLEMVLKNSIIQRSAGTGTGINNAKRRLALMYPGKHTLEITTTELEFIVKLRIQL